MYLCYKYLLYFDFFGGKRRSAKNNIHTVLQKRSAAEEILIYIFIY